MSQAVTEKGLKAYGCRYGTRYTRGTRKGNRWQNIIIGPDTVRVYEAWGSPPVKHRNGRGGL